MPPKVKEEDQQEENCKVFLVGRFFFLLPRNNPEDLAEE